MCRTSATLCYHGLKLKQEDENEYFMGQLSPKQRTFILNENETSTAMNFEGRGNENETISNHLELQPISSDINTIHYLQIGRSTEKSNEYPIGNHDFINLVQSAILPCDQEKNMLSGGNEGDSNSTLGINLSLDELNIIARNAFESFSMAKAEISTAKWLINHIKGEMDQVSCFQLTPLDL